MALRITKADWRSIQTYVAIALILSGFVLLLIQNDSIDSSGDSVVQSDVVTFSSDTPDETPIDPGITYNVPADQPRRILIEKLSVDGFIQPVGVDQHGAIAVPSNVHLGGWFIDRAKPGEPGLSIIDGHVRGWNSSGIFERLDELEAGDTFQVEMGDLSIREFRIFEGRNVGVEEANSALYERTSESQLNLITCTGPYNADINGYEERHIVYAELIE